MGRHGIRFFLNRRWVIVDPYRHGLPGVDVGMPTLSFYRGDYPCQYSGDSLSFGWFNP